MPSEEEEEEEEDDDVVLQKNSRRNSRQRRHHYRYIGMAEQVVTRHLGLVVGEYADEMLLLL